MRLDRAIQGAALLVAALIGGIIAAVCVIMWQQPKPVDFLAFWAAGKMVIAGNSAAVYDIAAHKAVQQAAVSSVGNFPFPYPPPFALLAVPFALLPLGLAFTVWVIVTGVVYVVASCGW